MLSHPLALAYDPNLLVTAAITRCLSPLITMLAYDRPKITAFKVLVSHPEIDLNRRSPIYGVHPLHLATTYSLSPFLKNFLQNSHSRPPATLLSAHTHITCLALTIAELPCVSLPFVTSVTQLRSLSTKSLSADIKTRTDPPSQTARTR